MVWWLPPKDTCQVTVLAPSLRLASWPAVGLQAGSTSGATPASSAETWHRKSRTAAAGDPTPTPHTWGRGLFTQALVSSHELNVNLQIKYRRGAPAEHLPALFCPKGIQRVSRRTSPQYKPKHNRGGMWGDWQHAPAPKQRASAGTPLAIPGPNAFTLKQEHSIFPSKLRPPSHKCHVQSKDRSAINLSSP